MPLVLNSSSITGLSAVGGLSSPQTGSALQVVNSFTESGGTFSTSSSSFVASGFIFSITPTRATSKILIFANGTNNYNLTAGGENQITFYRQIASGSYANVAGAEFLQINGAYGTGANFRSSMAITFLDSPNTTSQCNYQIYGKTNGTGSLSMTPPSLSFILMEIAA
jgi:hypothetical protein